MSFSLESGYVPVDIDTIMLSLMDNINIQFELDPVYTMETFIGTRLYKYFYAIAQEFQENEVKTSEIFQKLQVYIDLINVRISRPVVTNPGIIEKLETEGYTASVKPMELADAGMINICVDVDDSDPDYATTKLALCTLISQITVGGAVTQGSESETIVLSNAQPFDFKYHLPNRIDALLRLTITLSENNQFVISSPEDVKQVLLDNIEEKYRLGLNFEPQKYFSITDAPWASKVLLEWSTNAGADWNETIYEADFDDLFEVPLENIELVEA